MQPLYLLGRTLRGLALHAVSEMIGATQGPNRQDEVIAMVAQTETWTSGEEIASLETVMPIKALHSHLAILIDLPSAPETRFSQQLRQNAR